MHDFPARTTICHSVPISHMYPQKGGYFGLGCDTPALQSHFAATGSSKTGGLGVVRRGHSHTSLKEGRSPLTLSFGHFLVTSFSSFLGVLKS